MYDRACRVGEKKMNRSIATLASLVFLSMSAASVAQECNRDCLRKHLDTYLNGVVAHKPEAANLWVGFRQTENSVVVPEGQGAWTNVTRLGSLQRRYLDPIQSQAGY